MGCHPHTRVNPAQHTIRKESQEPMWLQTICKSLFQHNKEASNTRGGGMKNESGNERCVQVTHASYTINVPLNNFNIHQPNKEAIHMNGYQPLQWITPKVELKIKLLYLSETCPITSYYVYISKDTFNHYSNIYIYNAIHHCFCFNRPSI